MSNFIDFKKSMIHQFDSMLVSDPTIFETSLSGEDLWELYLNSYPEGTNNIFRERREYDCSSCKSFIKHYGNLVTVRNNKLTSIWDNYEDLIYPYNIVSKAMSEAVKNASITNVFFSKFKKLGNSSNKELLEDGSVCTWEHFSYDLPKQYVDRSSRSIPELQNTYRTNYQVFKRSLEELTLSAGEIILDLIEQGSLYRGSEHKNSIDSFIKTKIEYDKIPDSEKDNWLWVNSITSPISRIRNNAIGTLLIDISNDVDLNEAVRKFDSVMAPSNYKRPKEIFTKKMIEEAEKKLEELGLSDSLERKFASLEDITVNNVLFVDRSAKKKLKGSVFDEMKESVSETPKSFSKVEEVTIETFMKDILPKSDSVSLMFENRHSSNLMSLVAPVNREAPSILKWSNNFSWSYNGDVTDRIKENVKKAGGKVDGVLRFSIQWNEKGDNKNDFDAHCHEPGGHIFFGNTKIRETRGNLDVDIINPKGVAVENITWPDKSLMKEGSYKFLVNNYSHRGGTSGFSAEIEFDGQIFSFEYPRNIKGGSYVDVAVVTYSKKDGFSIKEKIESTVSSKELWGITTNKFHKVSVIMNSPNYWDGQKGVGNKHYFFFLEGCKTENSVRGFYNEFLNEGLMPHRKVFEALGSRMRVPHIDEQLSGLGFSSTIKNDILVKVEGNISRVMKIIF